MKDGRFCKVIEVYPINFSLKSKAEQEDILYKYKTFLNACNFDIQILVQSRKGNLDNHILKVEESIEKEEDKKIVNLMHEYIEMIRNETLKSAITKRFFIVFSTENVKKRLSEEQALIELQEKTVKVKNTLSKCGNSIKDFNENNDELVDVIYTYMNPITSQIQNFKEFSYEYKN